MKLLILTQKVDKNDSVLGFFHRWLEEFSQNFEYITVVCLELGEYNLPSNVKVLGLGKEAGQSRIKYLYRFYKYVWQERDNYDAVFVHMNAEYVSLGAILWKILKKKIYLWYVHPKYNYKLKLALLIADKIFTVHKTTFPLCSQKIIYLGHGIDINLFKPNAAIEKKKNSVLYLGRLASVKKIDKIIAALKILQKNNYNFHADFFGNALDKKYENELHIFSKELISNDAVKFHDFIPNIETPKIYNSHELLISLTETGSFDKVILEAMSCETLVLSTNKSLRSVLGDLYLENTNPEYLQAKILHVLTLTADEKENIGHKFREYVIENHNLEHLVEKIYLILKEN